MDAHTATLLSYLRRQRPAIEAFDGPQDAVIVDIDGSDCYVTVPDFDAHAVFGPAPCGVGRPGIGDHCVVVFVGPGVDKPRIVALFSTASLMPDAILDTLVDARGDLIAGTADNTVGRLAVGADGKVLMADSGQATGLAWATLVGARGPAFFGPASPLLYATAASHVANTTYYQRVRAQESFTLTQLKTMISAAGAGNVTLGIYSDSGGAPNARLASGTDTSSTAGAKTVTLGSSVAVTAGTHYWLAYAEVSGGTHVYSLSVGTTFSDFARQESASFPATAGSAGSGAAVPLVYALMP